MDVEGKSMKSALCCVAGLKWGFCSREKKNWGVKFHVLGRGITVRKFLEMFCGGKISTGSAIRAESSSVLPNFLH